MATNYASASFSEVYDMHTEVGKTTLLGIHTPITNRHQRYLNGFFTQFKKFRYKGASLSFVPVATLPADPLQVSYEAGDLTIDPRDLMNPIIHCGMHGESMGKYLDSIFHMNISDHLSSMDVSTPDSDQVGVITDLENAYYTALSSPTFKKSHPQQGFRKSGLHPMVYSMSTNRPYAVSSENFGNSEPSLQTDVTYGQLTMGPGSAGDSFRDTRDWTGAFSTRDSSTSLNINQTVYESRDGYHYFDYGQFFTNKLTSLGWLDTLQNQTSLVYGGTSGDSVKGHVSFTGLPKVYMYFVMLPPAYKTEMYFRVIIRHFFEFRDFRPYSGPFSFYGSTTDAYDGVIDNPPVDAASMTLYNGDLELISDGAS